MAVKRRLPPKKESNSACHQSQTALILIDVLNEFDFPGSASLLKHALPMARQLAKLKAACRRLGIPVVYANDNFGQWRSDRHQVLSHCVSETCKGREIAQLLFPDDDDYFILKPKHSAFFSTNLETLLSYFGARTLILAGIAGNICVLHTAMDAHIRGFELVIPKDGIASAKASDQNFVLHQFKEVLDADLSPCTRLISQLRKMK
jgi:nicotinamidase-related amidase